MHNFGTGWLWGARETVTKEIESGASRGTWDQRDDDFGLSIPSHNDLDRSLGVFEKIKMMKIEKKGQGRSG